MADETGIDSLFDELVRARFDYENATQPMERRLLLEKLSSLRARVANEQGSTLSQRSIPGLEREARTLRRELETIAGQRWDPSMAGTAGNAATGIDPLMLIEHNQKVDRVGGRRSLERQFSAVLAELERRADEAG